MTLVDKKSETYTPTESAPSQPTQYFGIVFNLVSDVHVLQVLILVNNCFSFLFYDRTLFAGEGQCLSAGTAVVADTNGTRVIFTYFQVLQIFKINSQILTCSFWMHFILHLQLGRSMLMPPRRLSNSRFVSLMGRTKYFFKLKKTLIFKFFNVTRILSVYNDADSN